ncbi:hypothetical protein ACOSQ4_025862 [Xanthoceras sorbifolium]
MKLYKYPTFTPPFPSFFSSPFLFYIYSHFAPPSLDSLGFSVFLHFVLSPSHKPLHFSKTSLSVSIPFDSG